jgi:hypothetical protein
MKSIKLILPMALLVMTCGCAAVVAAVAGAGVGIATYAYVTGDLKIEYPVPYDTVWEAALKALQDLNITVDEATKDGISGDIKAKRADNTPVHIKVKREAPEVTIVKIRTGVFGDKKKSIVIMEAIDKYLSVE